MEPLCLCQALEQIDGKMDREEEEDQPANIMVYETCELLLGKARERAKEPANGEKKAKP